MRPIAKRIEVETNNKRMVTAGPLSWTQEMLFHLQMRAFGSPALCINNLILIEGELNRSILRQAYEAMILLHEPLRTRYVLRKGVPCAQVLKSITADFQYHDLCDLPPVMHPAVVSSLISVYTNAAIDLSSGRPSRCVLLRLGEKLWALLLGFHHICADGWSIDVFNKGFSKMYRGLASGGDLPAMPQMASSVELARLQEEWLKGLRAQAHLDWWRGVLKQIPRGPLLTGSVNSTAKSDSIDSLTRLNARQSVRVGPAFVKRVRAVADGENVSVFMILLTAFKLLLAQWTKRTHIVVSTHMANRTWPQSMNVMGAYYNTVPLATELGTTEPAPREALKRITRTCFEAYEHQGLPFGIVTAMADREMGINLQDMFRISFIATRHPMYYFKVPGANTWDFNSERADRLRLEEGKVTWRRATEGSDLSLTTWETDSGLTFILDYRTELFAHERMTLLLEQFISSVDELLQSIAGPTYTKEDFAEWVNDCEGLIRRCS